MSPVSSAGTTTPTASLVPPLLVALLVLFLASEELREPLAPQPLQLLRVRGGGGGGRSGGTEGGFPLDLRVMILSMASSARKRAAVRLASLPTVDASAFRVGYLFLLTQPPGEEAQRALSEENATFGDLHFADDAVLDADLAMKVWRALGEAAARADAPFFLKLDDDHMVFYDRCWRRSRRCRAAACCGAGAARAPTSRATPSSTRTTRI